MISPTMNWEYFEAVLVAALDKANKRSLAKGKDYYNCSKARTKPFSYASRHDVSTHNRNLLMTM